MYYLISDTTLPWLTKMKETKLEGMLQQETLILKMENGTLQKIISAKFWIL